MQYTKDQAVLPGSCVRKGALGKHSLEKLFWAVMLLNARVVGHWGDKKRKEGVSCGGWQLFRNNLSVVCSSSNQRALKQLINTGHKLTSFI